MAPPTATYDLVLLLDPQAQEDARAQIVADARAAIEAQGELVRHDEWGERPLSYPIERRKSAEYHLLQFQPRERELLDGLALTLRITDGVLRFRTVRLRPGAPDMGAAPPSSAPPSSAPAGSDEGEPAAHEQAQAHEDAGEAPASPPAASEPA